MSLASVTAAVKAVIVTQFNAIAAPYTKDDIHDRMAASIATVYNLALPAGAVVMAKLTAATIASDFTAGLANAASDWDGWAICDGGNGTEDLTDKFVRSKVTGSGGTGGADTVAHTHAGPSHTHTSAAHSHSLDNSGGVKMRASGSTLFFGANGPSFSYTDKMTMTASSGTGSIAGTGLVGDTNSETPSATGASGTDSTGATSDDENMPAYHELVFLQKL